MKRLIAVAALAACAVGWGATATGAADPAPSLQQLVSDALPGDTVTVPPGVYPGNLVIDKPLTLIGEGWPVVDGGGKGDVIRVTAPDVTIRGFVIQGSSEDVSDEPAGIRVSADRSVIESNRIHEVMYGIELQDSGGHIVRNNTVSSIARFAPERRGHGIYLWHTTDNLVEKNTVHGVKDGFFVGFSSRNRIDHNRVTGSRYGIHYMYADDNSFEHNTFTGNTAGGVLMYSREITFAGNEFANSRSDASGYGLLFKDVDNVLVKGNRIHHNRLGISMEGAPATPGYFVTLEDNLIGFNQVGIQLTTTTSATFTGNTFMGNLQQVVSRGGSIEHHNSWSRDGRGNYWDEYQGYDAGGDGRGDIPFQYDGGFDALVEGNDALKAYAYTPARTALDLATSWFPAFRPEVRLIDDHPLMSPTITLASGAGWTARAWAGAAGILLVLAPVLALRHAASRFGRWPTC